MSFLNIILCYYFSLKVVLVWLKITLPKNKSIQKSRQHWSMRQRENSHKKNFSLQIGKIDRVKLWILAAYSNMLSFGFSSVIFKVFVADLEHVYICWKIYRITVIVLLILKCITHQTNTCSKSATEILKQDVKSVKS